MRAYEGGLTSNDRATFGEYHDVDFKSVKLTVPRMNTPVLITLYFPVYGLYCYF